MKVRNVIRRIKAPCGKCPYKLGIIETPANPCPQCRQNSYSSYEWFQKVQQQGKSYKNGDE